MPFLAISKLGLFFQIKLNFSSFSTLFSPGFFINLPSAPSIPIRTRHTIYLSLINSIQSSKLPVKWNPEKSPWLTTSSLRMPQGKLWARSATFRVNSAEGCWFVLCIAYCVINVYRVVMSSAVETSGFWLNLLFVPSQIPPLGSASVAPNIDCNCAL